MKRDNTLLVGRLQDVLDALGDREPSTRLEAQAVTEKIRLSKGHLDDEVRSDLENLQPRTRNIMLGFVERNRETEAAYTSSISEQLYSSKYRLLYELIQNADDSSYSKAASKRSVPYVQFILTPETLVIETNEDGFTRTDVEAICATGRSSKKTSASDTHIGEKGFGFKSVFSIAHEVHIQSGVWSFCFQHHLRDNGLGMVTPLDAEPEEMSDGVNTRITLRISDTTPIGYQKLLDAVRDTPETTIFFLQKLKKIHARMTRTDGRIETLNITKAAASSSGLVQITRSRELGDTKKHDVSAFLCFKHKNFRMPQDRRRKDRSSVSIELAFPIDPSTMEPKVSERGQHVFAYLPLQRLSQIQFLIQSDFITAANRESVMDCSWNEAICAGVAEAFSSWIVSDIIAEADHPLKYSWLDYLPTSPMEHPWKTLYSSIKGLLETKPILQSWEHRRFKPPSQLRQLPGFMLHKGDPILKDLADERYLAPEYSKRHSKVLDALGANTITWSEVIDRLQADLVSNPSRVRTKEPGDAWQEAFAKLTSWGMRDSSVQCRQRIKRLAIIPLAGGIQWTGAPGIRGGLPEVYFPTTGSIPIPRSIGLHLVECTAASNGNRRELFKTMGVKECPSEIVLSNIQIANIQLADQKTFGRSDILSQLRYLFHFHPQPLQIKPWICVPLVDGTIRKASSCSLYFPSDNEYDMYHLLPEYKRNSNDVAQFLSKSLDDLVQPTVCVRDRRWEEWLTCVTSARYIPCFTHHSIGIFGDPMCSISPALQAVLRHSPTKFLGTLKAHWRSYQSTANRIESNLRACRVPCKSGASLALCTTYLPSPAMLSKISYLGLSETNFPLLILPGIKLDEHTYRQWQFLEQFGVISRPDLGFYKRALEVFKSSNAVLYQIKIQEVYICMARSATVEEYAELRSFFDTESYIRDPQQDRWLSQKDCIWQGPDFVSVKAVLARSYEGNALISTFFEDVLRIRDCTIDNVIEEIETRRDNTYISPDLSVSRKIYSYLNTNARSDEDWQKIKDAFSTEKLVLGEDGNWHTRRTCLWRSAFPLAGYQDLSNIYPELESFFVSRLRIKKASPGMLIDELKRMAGEAQPQISEIRLRLIEIGMMLARSSIDSSVARALDSLQEVKFLPKKSSDGTSTLVNVTDDFAIADHRRYGVALAGHGVLLDFQVDEVQILHVVFQHLGLTHRYLSTMVKEVSRVDADSSENATLSNQLQAKAYALYCCAAKHMSIKALRGDRALFDQLNEALIYTSKEISTHLVLERSTGSLSVPSDRAFIHHEVVDAQLRIYVPEEQQQRRACYRSQIPTLLGHILGVNSSATFDISCIVRSNLRELTDILTDQDIPSVDWIEKPEIQIPASAEDESPTTPKSRSVFDGSDAATIVEEGSGLLTPRTPLRSYDRPERTPSRVDSRDAIQSPSPTQYPRLIEQVVQIARRASYRPRGFGVTIGHTPLPDEEVEYFDHNATFGMREGNEFDHDRRIGAVGEAFVFELLSSLNIPNFTQDNWQSTIRGTLATANRYASMQNWVGRETADLVYTDRTGALTQYLRDTCTGSFPEQISLDHDHARTPIEYYLEVKSTTSVCSTRFYLSSGQYKRMEDMALDGDQPPTRVYVILRVYDLTTPNVGLKIYVDPLRLRRRWLEFEAQQWIGKTL